MKPSDIERIPVAVEDGTPMEIINILAEVDCIDYERSIIECFGPRNLVRPDRAGEIQNSLRLVLDPDNVPHNSLFRLKDWHSPIIVSEVLKDALEGASVTGISFRSVNQECRDAGYIYYWDDSLRKRVIWSYQEREEFMRCK